MGCPFDVFAAIEAIQSVNAVARAMALEACFVSLAAHSVSFYGIILHRIPSGPSGGTADSLGGCLHS